MKAFCFLSLALVAAMALGALASPAVSAAQGVIADDPVLQATLERLDVAHVAFHNGNPEPSKAIWSHAADVTLTGGAGGAIEKGWDKVRPRLEWASAQYSRGRQTNERVSIIVSGDLALVLQYEHIWFHSSGQEKESERHYRVTTALRREAGEWRVVHRHADTMTERVTPR
jgi:ketosteroid isomerase-like protein